MNPFVSISISISIYIFVHDQLWSHVCLFATPRTVAHQAPLSMKFSREEYWSGLSFPTTGDLPYPGIKPTSLVSPALAGRSFTAELSVKPMYIFTSMQFYHM